MCPLNIYSCFQDNKAMCVSLMRTHSCLGCGLPVWNQLKKLTDRRTRINRYDEHAYRLYHDALWECTRRILGSTVVQNIFFMSSFKGYSCMQTLKVIQSIAYRYILLWKNFSQAGSCILEFLQYFTKHRVFLRICLTRITADRVHIQTSDRRTYRMFPL